MSTKVRKAVEQIVAGKGEEYLKTVKTMTPEEAKQTSKEMDRLIAERKAGLI